MDGPLESNGEDLIELVARALEALEDSGQEGLEQLLAAHPEHASVVRRRLSHLVAVGIPAPHRAERPAGVPEVLGDFRLLRPLGQGGMGVVWLAEQLSLGREVALKLVRPDQLLFPEVRARFRREVKVIAGLQHPGIVPVYAVGEEQGLPFFAMENVLGSTLAKALEAMGTRDPRAASGARLAAVLPREDDVSSDAASERSALFDGSLTEICVRIAREVAEALEHARRRGVVHRDVSPRTCSSPAVDACC